MLRLFLTMAAVGALAAGCQRSPSAEQNSLGENETSDLERGSASAQSVTVEGQIAKVDADQLELETTGGEKVDLKMGSNVLTPSGEPIQPMQLQEGAEVRASYTEQGGDKVISTLEVIDERRAPSPQGTPEPTEPAQPSEPQPEHQPAQ